MGELSPLGDGLSVLSMKVVAETGSIDSGERALESESGMEHNAFLTESISNLAMSARTDVCMSRRAVSLTSSCFVIVIARF